MQRSTVVKIVLTWLAWWVILFAFQGYVLLRIKPQRPDYALGWTISETARNSQNNKPYLLDPFLNEHVSWDSEFYLGVGDSGYDNDKMRQIPGLAGDGGKISISYAFFPLNPALIHALAGPLGLLGLSRIATLTLAGLLIALFGTLGAMLALADLARGWLGEIAGRRAAFYLLIFPTGFFLAQVYSEGLFLCLTFGALALIQRRRLVGAGILAALAIWTRAVGAAILLPLGLAVLSAFRGRVSDPNRRWLAFAGLLLPLISMGILWQSTYLARFRFIEDHYFSRGLLAIGQSLAVWSQAWKDMLVSGNLQGSAYYGLEFFLIGVGLIGSLALMHKMPLVALFSLAIFVLSFFSGVPQSMNRYVLSLPAVFLMLAKLGENEAFDRGWTIASLLWMGLLTVLFSFDLWVG